MKVSMGRYPKDHNKKRKVEVRIDKYDVWSLDHTLALIIAPALKVMRENLLGAPLIDDEDVPEELRRPKSFDVAEFWTDPNWHNRWEYVLDEMIFAFENHANIDWVEQFYPDNGPADKVGLEAHMARMANGRRLFAKYYDGLWT